MDFGFSEQQREVQTLARQILSREVSPEKLAAYDEFRAERFDAELWGKLAEAGLLGVAVDEAYGGMGFGFTELALLVEELGRSIAPLPLLAHVVSAALPVQKFGSAAMKERLLPGVVQGVTLLTAGLLEPVVEDPSCPASVTASVDGGGYRVSGVKSCVPFAGSASRILISARTDTGVVALLLDPTAPGVSLTPQQYTTYEPQCELSMNEALVAGEDVLAGPENGGRGNALRQPSDQGGPVRPPVGGYRSGSAHDRHVHFAARAIRGADCKLSGGRSPGGQLFYRPGMSAADDLPGCQYAGQ